MTAALWVIILLLFSINCSVNGEDPGEVLWDVIKGFIGLGIIILIGWGIYEGALYLGVDKAAAYLWKHRIDILMIAEIGFMAFVIIQSLYPHLRDKNKRKKLIAKSLQVIKWLFRVCIGIVLFFTASWLLGQVVYWIICLMEK